MKNLKAHTKQQVAITQAFKPQLCQLGPWPVIDLRCRVRSHAFSFSQNALTACMTHHENYAIHILRYLLQSGKDRSAQNY